MCGHMFSDLLYDCCRLLLIVSDDTVILEKSGSSIDQSLENQHQSYIVEHIWRSPSVQGSQSEPLRRVRVAYKATSTFPHACASFISEGDWTPTEKELLLKSSRHLSGGLPPEINPAAPVTFQTENPGTIPPNPRFPTRRRCRWRKVPNKLRIGSPDGCR